MERLDRGGRADGAGLGDIEERGDSMTRNPRSRLPPRTA
jgi:hypothetical protein